MIIFSIYIHYFIFLGTLNTISSLIISTSFISNWYLLFNWSKKFLTNISGADAPEDTPIVSQSLILSKGIILSEWIKCESMQPDFFATSTNLTELDEFLLPMTKNISHFWAIFFTAFCLFVVA